MIWFSSDLHFCHDRAFLYAPRGFESIDDMNETIVKNWNSIVAPTDEVYLLGDIMLNDNEKGMEYLRQLNGNIRILRGNHDTDNRVQLYPTSPNVVECGKYADVIKWDKFHFYLSHYPTNTSILENMAPLSQHIINLHGHTHSKDKFYNDIPYMYNVALDAHNNFPVSAEQVIEDIKNKVNECMEML